MRPLALMLALTFSTGVVDAVGYLGLDRVFPGNMTGNVALLGMALTGSADLPTLRLGFGLLGFVVGATIGGRVLPPARQEWTPRTTVVLVAVTLLLAAATTTVFVSGGRTDDAVATAITTALALAMGLQATVARRLGIADVTTVVVTSTIVGLSSDSRLAGGGGHRWRRRVAAIACIVLGAAAGAALLRWHVAAALLVSVVTSAIVSGWGHLALARRGSEDAQA